MNHTVAISDDGFQQEVLEAPVPVLVDFWAPWCEPCHHLAPILDQIAVDYAGCLKVAKVDVSHHRVTARQYGVTSIPALWLFIDGRAVEMLMGFHSREQVLAAVDAHLAVRGQCDKPLKPRTKLLRRLLRSYAPAA